jgi:hypothetical protein
MTKIIKTMKIHLILQIIKFLKTKNRAQWNRKTNLWHINNKIKKEKVMQNGI